MSKAALSPIQYQRGELSNELLLELYRQLLVPRLIEEKMLILLRQGRISKWFSGIGQEAISVGTTAALESDEFIFTLHRNLGVFTTRNVPMHRLFAQWQGKLMGYTKGRDRSFHFGTMEHHIVGMISHLGPQLSLADGVGLAHRIKGEPKVTLAFTGEGGTSEGEFHEALNVAAVWQLPVIFVIENNGYGLSTPTYEQYRCENLADKGPGYGMRSLTIDGNNILEVYQTVRQLAEELRAHPEPVLLECRTFRRRGHEEASGTKYVPTDLMDYWEERDPITNYAQYLLENGILQEEQQKTWIAEIKKTIKKELQIADEAPLTEADLATELSDLYAHHEPAPEPDWNGEGISRRFIDAISEGLGQAMEIHPDLVLMGQDIADYGGVFKITDGFMERFGADRVRNTPLCESAIVGVGLGLSLKSLKAMVEMQFADFVSCGFNQIVNNLAKLHYRWGQSADVVIRMPTGAGTGAGPYHSQSNEAWFFHVPGLKIVYPSTPYDAKGLLLAAFADPNPVLFFEHKALYRSLNGPVPETPYEVPIGKARTVRSGRQLSILTYGYGVRWALDLCESRDLDADIIDLRSLLPLDYEAISASVRKTNRVIILHEDTLLGGIGAELSAYISEHLFAELDAPVLRVGSLDTPVPFAADLERQFLPQDRLQRAVDRLIAF
ncbi:MAG: dehydrogenase E1 component subunit alpha/beta [Lewinella sp.]|nr:dehydrogenase E1 component subunit alpha/beta [Lewinella sp.]